MKFKSQVYTAASGSIGGITYAHNKGGMYTRSRATPTNPNSTQQQATRAALAQLSDRWVNVLTDLQRLEWTVYASNTPVVDRLGDPLELSGIQMYVRNNVPRVQAALGAIDDAPATFSIGSFTNPTLTCVASTQLAGVAYDNSDTWATATDGALLVYLSRPQNASITFFKGPYRFAGSVLGDDMTPPTSPASFAVPFTIFAGQKVFGFFRATQADGRLSYPFRNFCFSS